MIHTHYIKKEKSNSRKLFTVICTLALLTCSLVSSYAQVSQTFNSSSTFTVPAGVTTLTVECWGGGGGGGGVNAANAGAGGGGGGAYSKSTTISVTPGNVYTVTVGPGGTGNSGAAGGPGGDSWFGTASTIMAKGGLGGPLNTTTGVAGGTAAASIGTTKFDGGTGGNGTTSSNGGGGGGGGGNAANGGNGSGSTAGAGGTAGGGIGGGGATTNAAGSAGTQPGGAGGGAKTGSGATARAGGVGGAGRVIVTYTPPPCSGTPTPGNTQTSASLVCPTTSFTLSFTGTVTGSGITYQWQSSPDNIVAYSNIGSATNATYATTQSASTYYRCAVTCSGNTGISTPIQVVSNNFMTCYCTPGYGNSCSVDYINTVTFGSINNANTGCTGSTPSNLTYYSAFNPTLSQSVVYPLTVITGGDVEAVNVWIDYNHSGVFESTESVLSGFAGTNPATYSANVTIPLTSLQGQTRMRVRCRYNTAVGNAQACNVYGSSDYGEVEDYLITIGPVPSCLPPTALTVGSLTSTTATISWTAPSPPPASGYEYVVSTSSSTPSGAGTASASTSVPISGLSTNTTYYLFVRSICAVGNESSWSGPVSFTTPCSATTVPYAQNFDGVTAPAIPACWTIVDSNTDGFTWKTYSSPPSGGSSPNCLNYQYNSASAANDWAFSQGLTLTAGVNYQLTFKYACISASFPERLEIKWGNSPSAAGMTGGTLFSNLNIINTTYATGTAYFSPVSSGTYYLGLHCISLADEDYLFVDDVSVGLGPACIPPTNITAGSITTSSANISFVSGATSFIVEYGAPGFTPGTAATPGAGGTIVTGSASPIPLSGLSAGTSYDVYVRTNCTGSGNGYSANSSVTTFMTLCNTITTIPFAQGFDTPGVLPNCWTTALVTSTTIWAAAADDGDFVFTPHTGAGMAVKNYDGAASDALLISPAINLNSQPSQQVRVNVWIYRNSNGVNGDRVRFFANTSPNTSGASLLIDVRTLITSAPAVASAGWYNYIGNVPLSFNAASSFYIIAEGNTTASLSSYSVGFDDFVLENVPACPTAPVASLSGITATSASIAFTCASCTGSYVVEYGPPGFTPGTGAAAGPGGTVVTGASSPISIGPLTSNTSYTVFVRNNCSASNYSSNSAPLNITTPCPAITTFPYSQSFDALGVYPGCWTHSIVASTTEWIMDSEDGDGIFTPHSGAGMAVKNWDGAASDALLISPPFNVTANSGATTKISVWIYRNVNGVNGDRIRFFVNSAPNTTGASLLIDVRPLITSAPVVAAAGWYNYTADIPLSFKSGGDFFIIAEGNTTASLSSYSVGFDDFSIDQLVCLANPTAPINGSSICPGAGTTLSWPALPGATGYNVYLGTTSPATTLVSSNQAGLTYNAGSLAGGNTYYWSVVPVGPGATSCTTWSFTLSPVPDPNASSNSPVCAGNPLGLSSSNNGAGQTSGNSYVWSGPGFSSTQQNPSISGSASPSHAGTYTVTITNSFGCTASTSTVVTVNTNPTGTAAVTDVSCNGLCDGGVVITPTGGQSPFIFTDGVNVNTDGIFTGTYCAGPLSVDVFDDNGCTATIPFTVTEPDLLVISSATPVNETCAGLNNGSISVSAAGGTTAYAYSKDNGSTFQSSNAFNGLAPGNYNIVVKDAHECITGSTMVTIAPGAPLPSAAITGSQNICQPGGTASLSIAFTQAGPWTYSYSDGTSTFGPFSTSGNPEVVNVSPGSTRTYTVTSISNGCVGTTSGSALVTVSTAPPTTNLPFPTVPTYACNGNSFTASTGAVTNTLVYTWDGPAGTSFNSSGNPYSSSSTSVTVNFGPPNGSGYNICVQGSNACGATTRRCSFVRGTVNVPGVITPVNGRTVECASTSANYSIAAVTGATGYTWTSSNPNATVVGSGTSATVTFGAGWTGTMTTTLSVTANTPCYSSAPRSLLLSTSTAAPGAISGSATACPGSSVTYSVPVAPGAATYNWVLPANTTGSSSSNSILVNFLPGFSFGDIKISITSICGITSAQQLKTVSSGLPAMPASISGNLNGLCGQTITYSCPSVSGASTYTWTTPGTINSGQGSTSINVTYGSFTSGTVCVKANNACGSGAQRCVPVQGSPVAPGTITYSPNPVCANQSGVDLQVAPVYGTTGYAWTFPAGVTSVLNLGNEQVVNWGPTGGTVTVTVSNACGNASKNQNISLGCREIAPEEVTVNSEVTVYPNPAHDRITVQFNAAEKTNYVLNLMDLSGRVISTSNAIAQKGINTSEMDLSMLAKGVYMIDIKSELLNKQVRVIIE